MDAILLDKGIPGMRMERLRRASPFEMKVLHAHTFWEIYYLLEGECIYFIDGRSYALERGADYVFQTDSDGQTCPEEFWPLWEARASYDYQIGWRRRRADGLGRSLVTRVLACPSWCAAEGGCQTQTPPSG